jgi:hypothetical protein
MRLPLAMTACLGLFAFASTAEGDQRYADSESTGPEPCVESAPCSLKQAVDNAKSNDEVIVRSGVYILASTDIEVSPEKTGVYIHGDFSAPRPTIVGSYPGSLVGMFGPEGRLAYLDITNNSNSQTVTCYPGVTIERVRVAVKGTGARAVDQADSCLIRDSVVRAEGESSVAISAFGGFASSSAGAVRNVTAIAIGPKTVALKARGSLVPAGTYTSNVRNSILSGDLYDIQSVAGGAGASNVTVAYSNFDVARQEPTTLLAEGSGNQSSPPQFLNAGAGDYREAAGSPTIDSGADEKLGSSDFDGNPRFLGSAPDIGAFEFVPPPVALPALSGQIQSLAVTPHKFRAAGGGEAISSVRKKAPLGSRVTYSLSAGATVAFSIERRLPGRKVGKRCVKKTKVNQGKKRCSRFMGVRGKFTHSGQAGQSRFRFSGRIAGRSLKPGSYRLVGKTGSVSKAASFRIVE